MSDGLADIQPARALQLSLLGALAQAEDTVGIQQSAQGLPARILGEKQPGVGEKRVKGWL